MSQGVAEDRAEHCTIRNRKQRALVSAECSAETRLSIVTPGTAGDRNSAGGDHPESDVTGGLEGFLISDND